MKTFHAIVLAAALAGCATMEPLPPPPTTAEIVQMAKSGQTADAIIRRMQESRAVYALPASELAKLREQGVPDAVIDYMQQTYLAAERYREWVRMHDTYLFPPYYPYRRYPYWRSPYWW